MCIRDRKEVGIKKRFSDPHPDDLEKKEFKLVEPRSKRVKNKSKHSPKKHSRENRNNSRRENSRERGRRNQSKGEKRKHRFSNLDGSPRNWGEQKKGRASRKFTRQNGRRRNNRRRGNNRNKSRSSKR